MGTAVGIYPGQMPFGRREEKRRETNKSSRGMTVNAEEEENGNGVKGMRMKGTLWLNYARRSINKGGWKWGEKERKEEGGGIDVLLKGEERGRDRKKGKEGGKKISSSSRPNLDFFVLYLRVDCVLVSLVDVWNLTSSAHHVVGTGRGSRRRRGSRHVVVGRGRRGRRRVGVVQRRRLRRCHVLVGRRCCRQLGGCCGRGCCCRRRGRGGGGGAVVVGGGASAAACRSRRASPSSPSPAAPRRGRGRPVHGGPGRGALHARWPADGRTVVLMRGKIQAY